MELFKWLNTTKVSTKKESAEPTVTVDIDDETPTKSVSKYKAEEVKYMKTLKETEELEPEPL